MKWPGELTNVILRAPPIGIDPYRRDLAAVFMSH